MTMMAATLFFSVLVSFFCALYGGVPTFWCTDVKCICFYDDDTGSLTMDCTLVDWLTDIPDMDTPLTTQLTTINMTGTRFCGLGLRRAQDRRLVSATILCGRIDRTKTTPDDTMITTRLDLTTPTDQPALRIDVRLTVGEWAGVGLACTLGLVLAVYAVYRLWGRLMVPANQTVGLYLIN